MCGRTRCTLRPDDILGASHLNGCRVRHVDMDRYRPSYNVSPGFYLPVVRRDDGQGADGQAELGDQEPGAVLHCMKWGLIPSFTKKTEKPDHYKMFNARSQSIREKASFRRLVPTNRCLVAVEGFYEWKKDGSKRQPYYIHFKDGRPLVFAALFDSWKNPEGEVLYTFTIVTTSSSSSLAWLHDRMPVILGKEESTEMWLNAPSSSNFDTILKPYEETDLAWYPVTPAMGKPSFDGPECIKELKQNKSRPILEFFSKKGAGRHAESELHSETTTNEAAEINPPRMEESATTAGEDTEINPPQVKESVATMEGATEINWPEIKKECVIEDSENSQTLKVQDNEDTKPYVFNSHDQGTINISGKREYEELTADIKHSDHESGKQHASPLQKRLKEENGEMGVDQKEKTKNPSLDGANKLGKSSMKKKAAGTGEKQPTLFSYFGEG